MKNRIIATIAAATIAAWVVHWYIGLTDYEMDQRSIAVVIAEWLVYPGFLLCYLYPGTNDLLQKWYVALTVYNAIIYGAAGFLLSGLFSKLLGLGLIGERDSKGNK